MTSPLGHYDPTSGGAEAAGLSAQPEGPVGCVKWEEVDGGAGGHHTELVGVAFGMVVVVMVVDVVRGGREGEGEGRRRARTVASFIFWLYEIEPVYIGADAGIV